MELEQVTRQMQVLNFLSCFLFQFFAAHFLIAFFRTLSIKIPVKTFQIIELYCPQSLSPSFLIYKSHVLYLFSVSETTSLTLGTAGRPTIEIIISKYRENH